jgi:hypothetical protein
VEWPLPPGVYPFAVNKYYRYSYYHHHVFEGHSSHEMLLHNMPAFAKSVTVHFLPTVELFLFSQKSQNLNLWFISRPCTFWNIACHLTEFLSWNISSLSWDTGVVIWTCIVSHRQQWHVIRCRGYRKRGIRCLMITSSNAVIERLSEWVMTLSCVK